MTKRKYEKVNYSTIETGKQMPVAYMINGKVKTAFRTIKKDENGFFVNIAGEKQRLMKATTFKIMGLTTIVMHGTCAIDFIAMDEKKDEMKAKKAEKKAKKAEKKAPVKKAVKKDTAKKTTKAPTTKAPVKKEKEVAPEIEFTNVTNLIAVKFGENVFNTINGIVKRYVDYANAKRDMQDYYNFKDGMNALVGVESVEGLQGTMITYFLKNLVCYMARKFLEYGASYKQLEKKTSSELESELSYMNASSSDGKIRSYEVEEIFNELVIQAYTKKLDKNNMFENPAFVGSTIFFRVSNILRKELRRMKSFKGQCSIDEAVINYMEAFDEKQHEKAVKRVDDIKFLTDNEKELIRLRLEGYSKVEIEQQKGQRLQRHFKNIRDKFDNNEKALKELA